MALLEKKTIELGDGVFVDVDPKKDAVIIRIGEERKTEKKADLWAMCFTIADAKTQEQLLPVRMTELVTYKRIHNIELKKDMRKGDIVRTMCEINVPQVIHEGLAGNLTVKRKAPGIIIPRSAN